MYLLLKEYLLTHSLQDFEDEFGVYSRLSPDRTKVSLSYDMIMSVPGTKISDQCRGIVIRPAWNVNDEALFANDAWKKIVFQMFSVVSWPFVRFFNYGDANAAAIDWDSAVVYEKLDGTLCSFYYDDVQCKWHVATRSTSEAHLPFEGSEHSMRTLTFAQLFKKAAEHTLKRTNNISYEKWLDTLDKSLTYVFELTTPLNRVVVRYTDYVITLLGARHTHSGQEISLQDLAATKIHDNVPFAKSYDFKNGDVKSMMEYANAQDAVDFEGFVVVDKDFNRVKIKNQQWFAASRDKSETISSPRHIIRKIAMGSIDDVLPTLDDEMVTRITNVQANLRQYFKDVDAAFHTWNTAADSRKTFAEFVEVNLHKFHNWAMPFYFMYDGKVSHSFELFEQLAKNNKLKDSLCDTFLTIAKW